MVGFDPRHLMGGTPLNFNAPPQTSIKIQDQTPIEDEEVHSVTSGFPNDTQVERISQLAKQCFSIQV